MTELMILPDYGKKRLKLRGTVAAGEHVAVTVVGGKAWMGEGSALRLRVLFGRHTVAMFPFATEQMVEDDETGTYTETDEWSDDGDNATCTLNLNTIQAEKHLKFGGSCMWILDDVENHTLYGMGELEMAPWPKRSGEDVPYDLDEYPDIVANLQAEWVEMEAAWNTYQTGLEASLASSLAEKQDAIADLDDIRDGADLGSTAYQKPSGGIPKTDLSSAVQASLDKADTALQLQDIYGKADKSDTYTKDQTDAKIANGIASVVADADSSFDTLKEIADWIQNDTTGAAKLANDVVALQNEKADAADLAAVATSGSYNDLSDKPTIPAAQVQSDWNQADGAAKDFIKNKPTIPAAVTIDETLMQQGAAADAKATGDQLAAKLTRAEAEAGYTEWKLDSPYDVPSESNNWITLLGVSYDDGYWEVRWKYKNPGEDWNTDSFSVEGSIDNVHLSAGGYIESVSRHRITPTKTSQLTNDSGFLTSHQEWSDVKPSGGIPKTDLSSAVQASLNKADTALQTHQDISGKLGPYPFVTPTVAPGGWGFSGTAADTGYHWEIDWVNNTEDDGNWVLSKVPDEDGEGYEATSPSTAEGLESDLSVTFSNGTVAARSYVATLTPFTNAQIDMTAQEMSGITEFEVAVSASPVQGTMRDLILVVKAGATAPVVSFDETVFFPRTDATEDLAAEADSVNVYYITEYASGKFVVARWLEPSAGGGS